MAILESKCMNLSCVSKSNAENPVGPAHLDTVSGVPGFRKTPTSFQWKASCMNSSDVLAELHLRPPSMAVFGTRFSVVSCG